ncbi:MAG: GDP-mannose 4,6-dehydratase, partial [Candidatus Cloacimonetes bacterium]|nr:GDP-mannose 4,6-dehydratase [Candidatus Cloacimonadota bacterium]
CTNNYGPYQFPEKLIPLMIMNMMKQKDLPVYGDGRNIRDWLFVEDHCSGIHAIVERGRIGHSYNIGGENEWENIRLVHEMCKIMDERFPENAPHDQLITYVKDRPGHDRRYAINCDKIKNELGWTQSLDFSEGLRKTVDWYLSHQEWIENITSGEYLKWIEKNYETR